MTINAAWHFWPNDITHIFGSDVTTQIPNCIIWTIKSKDTFSLVMSLWLTVSDIKGNLKPGVGI